MPLKGVIIVYCYNCHQSGASLSLKEGEDDGPPYFCSKKCTKEYGDNKRGGG